MSGERHPTSSKKKVKRSDGHMWGSVGRVLTASHLLSFRCSGCKQEHHSVIVGPERALEGVASRLCFWEPTVSHCDTRVMMAAWYMGQDGGLGTAHS